jgi:DNA-binding NtrC family response regulator
MFLIIMLTAAVLAVTIFILGHLLTRPILKLAERVRHLDLSGRLEPITLPYRGTEFVALRDAINQMIEAVNRQVEEIRQRDMTIRDVTQRAPVLSTGLPSGAAEQNLSRVPGIVGFGTKIDTLRSEIIKAARVDADVLIQGETGTGKQLAAEAIHLLSDRAPHPFIAVSCGALDENLLLDTLFGHVRGAFTEARSERKGAFLQANNGTLFMDEIQSASPKVQQALLRAVSMRRIRPLGSDMEVEVNVRLIAAANVNLWTLIEKEMFREDLYYRLMVIPIYTPPLRDMPENIPVLANYFLQQHCRQTKRETMAFSKGALEKLCRYRWSGNIRELQHCVMRAVVMTDSEIIQADDIMLESAGDSRLPATAGGTADPDRIEPVFPRIYEPARPQSPPQPLPAEPPKSAPAGLNDRQRRAWPLIVERGTVRRHEYERWCGETISKRTAIYDLQDLVDKGHLLHTGRGRSTRYALPRAPKREDRE